jgi:uncharacterized protein (TIGR02646 family)
MIHVDRRRKEKNKIIKPADSWLKAARKKTEEAIKDGSGHDISNLYRDQRVKIALEKLFYDKCAYCESSLLTVEWEVEHYRPKGRVAENKDHPGYYWLAYKWENLYPACKYCNQLRKDHPRYDDPRELPAKGKKDQFPLENEKNRAGKPGDDLSKERPLLLDPCGDDPEPHFTYDIQGQIHPSETGDLFAGETIRICHLRRRRLRDNRARTIRRVSKLLDTIQKSQKAGNKVVEAELLDLLNDFTSPSSDFAGAARAVVQNPSAF